MKLKNKLLPLTTLGIVSAVVTPLVTLTSCKKDTTEMTTYDFITNPYVSQIEQYESENVVNRTTASKLYRDASNASDLFKDDLLTAAYENYLTEAYNISGEITKMKYSVSQPVIGSSKISYPGTSYTYEYPTVSFDLSIEETVATQTEDGWNVETTRKVSKSYKNIPFIVSSNGGSGQIASVQSLHVKSAALPHLATSSGFYGYFGIDLLNSEESSSLLKYTTDSWSINMSYNYTITKTKMSDPSVKSTQKSSTSKSVSNYQELAQTMNSRMSNLLNTSFTSHHLANVICADEIAIPSRLYAIANSPWSTTGAKAAPITINGIRFLQWAEDSFQGVTWTLGNEDPIEIPLNKSSGSPAAKFLEGNYKIVIPANAKIDVDARGYGSIEATVANYDATTGEPIAGSFSATDIATSAPAFYIPGSTTWTAVGSDGTEIDIDLDGYNNFNLYMFGDLKPTTFAIANPITTSSGYAYWDGQLVVSFTYDQTVTQELLDNKTLVIPDADIKRTENILQGYVWTDEPTYHYPDGMLKKVSFVPSKYKSMTLDGTGIHILINIGREFYFEQLEDKSYTVNIDFSKDYFCKDYFEIRDSRYTTDFGAGIPYYIEIPEDYKNIELTIPQLS